MKCKGTGNQEFLYLLNEQKLRLFESRFRRKQNKSLEWRGWDILESFAKKRNNRIFLHKKSHLKLPRKSMNLGVNSGSSGVCATIAVTNAAVGQFWGLCYDNAVKFGYVYLLSYFRFSLIKENRMLLTSILRPERLLFFCETISKTVVAKNIML